MTQLHHKRFLWICGIALGMSPFGGGAQTLDFASFRQQVLSNHPLVRQAELYRDQAQAGLLRAKGGFDPKLYVEHQGKNFNGKTYFQYTEAGVKVPTWAGLELKGTYNLASGSFLNSESTLPSNGQASFGFVWSVGQGLLFDERRAGLRMATVGLELGEVERQAARNDLLLEAGKAYWSWNYAENAVGIVADALQQALVRHEGLVESFRQGERAAIDTLETFIQVQNRQVELQFARLDAQNAANLLSTFLWTEAGQGISLASLPPAPPIAALETDSGMNENLESLMSQALVQHPELRYYIGKLRQLEVEQKLKNEKRKPVLDLSYNLLGSGWEFFPTATTEGPAMLANDVKWSVNFSYPILNRKARGDWQVTQIKRVQTDLELQQKRQNIRAKLTQYSNELQTLRTQAALFRNVASNYLSLLNAENERFALGESSVFLVNTREQRWLDAQLKYLKLLSELRKSEIGLQWAAGVLAD